MQRVPSYNREDKQLTAPKVQLGEPMGSGLIYKAWERGCLQDCVCKKKPHPSTDYHFLVAAQTTASTSGNLPHSVYSSAS